MATYQELYDSLKNDARALQAEIATAVRIDRTALHTDMVHHTSYYMTWAYLHALAEADSKKAKIYVDETILPIARLKAERICQENNRKVVQRTVDEIAFSDETYVMARDAMVDAQTRAQILKRVVETLVHKRDMLQSLNSRQKVELDALPDEYSPLGEDPAARMRQAAEEARRFTFSDFEREDPELMEAMKAEVRALAQRSRELRKEKRGTR